MKLFRHLIAIAVAALLAWGPSQAFAAATLLPNGEQCFQATAGINGMVGLLGTITGGTSGTTGTYGGVALTGGSGSGATANITVSGGAVTAVAILNPGTAYVVGDVLSAASGTIGNVTGFSVPVSSVSINSSLAGGTVAFYIPNTNTFKQTWFNADQAANHQNTNPAQLDANGCAIIYGTGLYRQVLKDSLGNTVWDQVTADTSANNNTFWAGVAGGTPNAITVTDPGFNATDGSVIQFIPVSSNTGPATLNPSSFGAVSIVKDTGTGAVALTGGEIVANSPSNVVSVVYSASQANFHILNLISPTNPNTPQTLCGAIGLKIVNDSGSPNTKMDVTADQVTMITTGGQTISRNNISLLLNLTVNGANGLDTGTASNDTWYNVWVVDNGSGAASLASLSATAPTLPSGYSYKCRLGAIRYATAVLLATTQIGNRTNYQPAAIQVGASGVQGTLSSTVFTGVSTAILVPPTATAATVLVTNANTNTNTGVAPNNSFSGFASQIKPVPIVTANITTNSAVYGEMMLETPQTVFYAATGASDALLIYGWRDKINAN